MATACMTEGLAKPSGHVALDKHISGNIIVEALAQSDITQNSPEQDAQNSVPPPNPPFVFPVRPAATFPTSYPRTTGPRPRSAVESGEKQFILGDGSDHSLLSSPVLPAFSFNPGARTGPDSPFLSPPLSPQSPRTITRPIGHGHRRGGSEFVGGSIRSGDAVAVMGTSPTKSESGFASPTFAPARLAGRRGHAHRRSTALSSHDLSSIMNPTKANPSPTGYATPLAAGEGNIIPQAQEAQRKEMNDSAYNRPDKEVSIPETKPEPECLPPPKHAPRVRVGFSEDVEYIPRPLSLVSNDTSSTITAKPGHNISGSISSLVSVPTPAPTECENGSAETPDALPQISESRPSTAGAILERTHSKEVSEDLPASPRRRNSTPLLLSLGDPSVIHPSSPGATKTPKRWSFFGLDAFTGTLSPRDLRPISFSSSDSSSRDDGSSNSSTDNVSKVSSGDTEKPGSKSQARKSLKKQKKVKAWAGSILARRSKARQKMKAVTITLNSEPITTSPIGDLEAPTEEVSVAFNMATTAPPMPMVMVTSSPDLDKPKTVTPGTNTDDDGSYPIIDLDAALGPFNTPLPFNPEWEAAQRVGAPMKRKLHSAAGMSNFSGPGGHYHRRAESAPEMVPFEQGRFSMNRFGSSSNMADVFEEEEEEEEGQIQDSMTAATVSGGSSQYFEESMETSVSRATKTTVEMYSGAVDKTKQSASSLPDSDSSQSQPQPPTISACEGTPIPSSTAPDAAIFEISRSPRDYCDSTEASPRRIVPLRELAPVDVSLQLPSASLAPGSPFSTTHSSSFPSPRSPISYDANRVSTAPSSIAEENTTFQSLLMGEPGPEVRYSIDADIPSLTSSNSTMTKDSSFPPHPRSSHGNLSGQRPLSFSSGTFSRRRSSLVSLTRLIGSSHGEKSKLSTEVTCDSEPDKKNKDSKTKRISRKLQFWRPGKEPASSD